MVSISRQAFVLVSLGVSIIWFILSLISATKSNDAEMNYFLKGLLPTGNCLCQSSTAFDCASSLHDTIDYVINITKPGAETKEWEFQYGVDDKNPGLTDEQCTTSFPGLFEDILRAKHHVQDEFGSIRLKDIDSIDLGINTVRAVILDGHLRILSFRASGIESRQKALGILYGLQRAINIPGYTPPNIEFVFTVEDMAAEPSKPIWALTRRPRDENLWLVPDFGFWSWDIKELGPWDEVVDEVIRQGDQEWDEKIPKLVWRGTLNKVPRLRRALVDTSRGKSWSDVQEYLHADPPEVKGNHIAAVDQCKYMFIAHAEGRSYSGSLKYRQICHSVPIIHKLQWIQHYHYLMSSSGSSQNYVEVERDFSDLDETITKLIRNPKKAKEIADNNVKTFRERYLTVAADACYFRRLVKEWKEISFEPEVRENRTSRARGMRMENFMLLRSERQMDFTSHW